MSKCNLTKTVNNLLIYTVIKKGAAMLELKNVSYVVKDENGIERKCLIVRKIHVE